MIGRSRLHQLVEAFKGRRLVLYGDMVLDRFILGSPKRISREAPVIILRYEDERAVPGGGANALANIAALGGTVVPLAVVGDDDTGGRILGLLDSLGIATEGIVVEPGFTTVSKVRILAGGPTSLRHQVARYDIEDFLPSDGDWKRELLARVDALAGSAEAAVVSDYGYGVVFPEGVARLRVALPENALLVADSRFSLMGLRGVDGATPNLEELQIASGRELFDDEDVARAADELRHGLDARFVVATRGSRGLTLVEKGLPPTHVPVYGTDQVADVTGAGDTVIATLCLALAAGALPREAAVLADLAGGVVVARLGTATVSPAELHRAIDLAPFLHE